MSAEGKSECKDFDFIELRTLPYSSRRRKDQEVMSAAQNKRKGGLKERIFGNRRSPASKGILRLCTN